MNNAVCGNTQSKQPITPSGEINVMLSEVKKLSEQINIQSDLLNEHLFGDTKNDELAEVGFNSSNVLGVLNYIIDHLGESNNKLNKAISSLS